jgi:hypothetical protein
MVLLQGYHLCGIVSLDENKKVTDAQAEYTLTTLNRQYEKAINGLGYAQCRE